MLRSTGWTVSERESCDADFVSAIDDGPATFSQL